MARFIFVVGGVMSGVGKGVTTATIGKILQSKGFKVSAIKIDPYINVDAGTMNPIEHGEVFVLDDGTECDQDLGNYERFLELDLSGDNYMTTGLVYQTVINRERNLEYGGKCVEVVPHIPEEVISRINRVAKKSKAEEALQKFEEVASSIDGREVIISMKVGDEGQLYESVSPQLILEKLKEMGFEVKKNQIVIEAPIKEVGEFPIKVKFDHNLESEIVVIITGEKES